MLECTLCFGIQVGDAPELGKKRRCGHSLCDLCHVKCFARCPFCRDCDPDDVRGSVVAATVPVAGSGSPSYSPRSSSSWQSTIDEQNDGVSDGVGTNYGDSGSESEFEFGPRFRGHNSGPSPPPPPPPPVEHAPVLGGPGGNSWPCPNCTVINPPPDNPTPLDSHPDAVLCNFAICSVCQHAVGSHVWTGGEEHEQMALQRAALAEHARIKRSRPN